MTTLSQLYPKYVRAGVQLFILVVAATVGSSCTKVKLNAKQEALLAALTPSLQAVSPVTAAAGDTITLTGNNFLPGMTVSVGGIACDNVTITNQAGTEATCVLGSGSATGNDVVLTSPYGNSSSNPPPAGFAFLTYGSVSPPSGEVTGGTTLTLTGTGFQSGMTVNVGGVACGSVNVISSTQATCVLGSTGATGSGAVEISYGGVTATSPAGVFAYVNAVHPVPGFVIAAGGGISTGTGMQLHGTIGEPVAASASGTGILLYGGFQGIMLNAD